MGDARVIAIAAVLVVAVAGCGDGVRSGPAPTPPASQSRTDTSPPAPTTQTTGDCLRAQRRSIRHLMVGESWFYVVDEVMSSDRGRSTESARTWTRTLTRVRTKVLPACGNTTPTQMRPLVAVSRVGDSVDTAELDRLLVAMRRWVANVYGSSGGRLTTGIANDMHCLRHRDQMASVTYTIEGVPTARGSDVWLDLAITNHTDGDLSGGVNGSMRIVGNLPPTPRHESWGGSSADGAGASAQTTSHRKLLDVAGRRFHLSPTGRLESIRVSVWLSGDQFGNRFCTFAAHLR